jgi:hypothetical protein
MSVETNVTDEATPDEIAEAGVGLVARAMFRASQGDVNEAIEIGSSAMSVISSMTMDFRRQAARKEQTNEHQSA